MRDVNIDQLAEEMRDALADDGIEITRDTMRILVGEFFQHVETTLQEKKEVRFSMYSRDITHVFWPIDKQTLCNEFANGVGVSYQHLLKKKKLSKSAAKFLKNKMGLASDLKYEA
jgi:hypothetical protein